LLSGGAITVKALPAKQYGSSGFRLLAYISFSSVAKRAFLKCAPSDLSA
jgi:hypothetical protein